MKIEGINQIICFVSYLNRYKKIPKKVISITEKIKIEFLDSFSEITFISGSKAKPFCLPPLSVVYPFLFIKKKLLNYYCIKKIFDILKFTLFYLTNSILDFNFAAL